MRRFLAQRSVALILLGLLLAAPIGCNKPSQEPTEPSTPDASQQTPAEDNVSNYTGPAATVYTFLDGARRGDDATVKSMLSVKALEELALADLNIAPKASDSGRFEVGESQFSPTDATVAYVSSRLTEVDVANNQSHSEDIIWALRNSPEGWRIAGMVRTIFPGEPGWTFNFEDHLELAKQGEALQAEMMRRAQAATARKPDAPVQR